MRELLVLLLASSLVIALAKSRDDDDISSEEDNENEEEGESDDTKEDSLAHFLYKRMKQDASTKKKAPPVPTIYSIPGPQEPLPGRSHIGDYWPVFPFQNQYSGGLDLDPSISRHIGADLGVTVPSWGIMDVYGRFYNRISDTTTKFGYLNHPVNMLDLEREDFVQLMTDPSLHFNRVAKTYVPISCKPPLCNPYTMTFGLGIEHDYGGSDGVEGDIDVPMPISKGVAYRYPLSGKVYYDFENITVTYGQNLAPIDPFQSLFKYQYERDPNIAIHRENVPPFAFLGYEPPKKTAKRRRNKRENRRLWNLDRKDEEVEETPTPSESDGFALSNSPIQLLFDIHVPAHGPSFIPVEIVEPRLPMLYYIQHEVAPHAPTTRSNIMPYYLFRM